ncbi:MAG: hypothetical protein ACYTFA_00105 [Planctomycetota bacterium]|jgi:hypothetical protein
MKRPTEPRASARANVRDPHVPPTDECGTDFPLGRLDASLTKRLRTIVSRLRGYVLIEGIAWVVGFILAGFLIQGSLDFAARGMRWSMRAALLGLIVAGASWLIWWRVIAPLRLRIGLAEAARLVERRYPGLASVLISAVRFSGGEAGPEATNSPALMASVVDRASRQARAADFTVVLDSRRPRWAACGLVASLLILTGSTLYSPQMVGLWFGRNVLLQELPWPKRTRLVVELQDDQLIGARGDDLVVHAHAEGVQPREVEIIFTDASGRAGRETMVTVGRRGAYRYRYTFKAVQEEFEFYLRGGDDRTDTYKAVLLERPRVVETEMRIEPPAYTRMETAALGNDERVARVLPGSQVTLAIRTNKPVGHATLMAGRSVVDDAVPDADHRWTENPVPVSPAPDVSTSWRVTLSPVETNTYHFALVDDVGLTNKKPVRFSLRVDKDEPPRARLKLLGVSEMITPEARLPIELEFSDTYGLATAELVYSVAREALDSLDRESLLDPTLPTGDATELPEELIPLPAFKPHVTNFVTELSWPVSEGSLSPGDRLILSARALDFDTVSGPNHARTPDWMLRVVTRDELLAELARREQEYRMDFGRLIDYQEQLRGQLLTVFGRHRDSPQRTPDLSAALAPLERRQRNVAGSVNVVRQQFERIWAELRVNQLDTSDARQRLEEGIIAPLTRLAKRDLIAAADGIRRWSRDGSAETASLVDPQQAAVLAQMREVLTFMIQWEGYNEVVDMLRDIVRLQGELKEETGETLLEEAGDVFED